MRWRALVVGALLALPAPELHANTSGSPTLASVHDTLQQMRERRAAADAERGGSLQEMNQQRQEAAAAAAAQAAARQAARRRRSRGFPLVVFVREVGAGLFGRDGAVRGASTVARGVENEVRNAVRHVSGPVGRVFDEVDKIRQRVIEVAKRPFRPIFDRTGIFGQLLEEYADVQAGAAWDRRINRTSIGRTRARIERGTTRVNERLGEFSAMLDEIEANREEIDALWEFITGLPNERGRQIFVDLLEERLGVDFSEMSDEGRAAIDAARENVRRGAQGRGPAINPGVKGAPVEGMGRPPPTPPRVEGFGRRGGFR